MQRFARHALRHIALLGIVAAATSLAPTHAAHAESVYRCRGGDGAIAFQDRPCAAATTETIVEIAPAAPVGESPDYGIPAHRASAKSRSTSAAAHARREPVSYECRAADGETFYRHGACPKQIAAPASAGKHAGKRGSKSKGKETVAVSAAPMPRSEVCRKLASAGSIGRRGHEHDESVSTYDRNLGRDPCRYL